MKSKILFSILCILLITILYVPASYSQPTFNFVLTHDSLSTTTITNDTYEVDVIILSTAGAPIELAQIALGLAYNNSASNGGTITASFVPGSSGLTNTTQIPTNFNAATISGSLR